MVGDLSDGGPGEGTGYGAVCQGDDGCHGGVGERVIAGIDYSTTGKY